MNIDHILTQDIVKTAKARIDKYVGAVAFSHEKVRFSVLTSKGVKVARQLAMESQKNARRIIIHK